MTAHSVRADPGTTARIPPAATPPPHRRPAWLEVGFRNVLVDEYIRVTDNIVTDRLQALGDLQVFVSQVAAFVTHA